MISVVDKAEFTRKSYVSKETAMAPIRGWYYCGSHNFTGSAWGKIYTSLETKGPQLRINNWELGVFFPIRGSDNNQGDWFTENGVPVPYQRPPGRL